MPSTLPMSVGAGGSKKHGANSGIWTIPFSSVPTFQSASLMNSETPYPLSLSFMSDLDFLFRPDLTSMAITFFPSEMMKSISSLPSEVAKYRGLYPERTRALLTAFSAN